MAKKLDSFDFPKDVRYPWDTWFNGEIWEITQADIGDTTLENFRINALSTAKKKGCTLRTHIDKFRGVVVIQAI